MLLKYKKLILSEIFRYIEKEDCIVFLFGSFAEGNPQRSSDIDVGILYNLSVSDKNFVEACEAVENVVPTLRHIELVDFNSVDKKIKAEAIKEMKIWHIGKNCRELLKNLKQV